ncbi:ABC transporter permease [Aureimonas sp. SK2]|uniref:ABC transporter permease n=1 Tax=Aureimonas sp. SK2 TaxID=3015992 RepID=UPI002443C796|nr:ABC transporter permease [Aureimonas sp. SK2]
MGDRRFAWASVDKVGVPAALLLLFALLALPFATAKANRIVPGEAHGLLAALPSTAGPALLFLLLALAVAGALRLPAVLRLGGALVGLAGLLVAIGFASAFLAAPGNPYARVSPASGFWTALAAFALLATDALTRLRPSPALRLVLLGFVLAGVLALLGSGFFEGLSVMREYAVRRESFAQEALRHLALAFGSMAIAVGLGIPFALVAWRVKPLRAPALAVLNVVQTVPSIALFGLLIAPLGWIALHVPGASALGVRGIGAAPALVALVLYSLLPVVANTLAGLAAVPEAARDAATGIGMTRRQRLVGVELPLALPVILAGIRIVLVQNIGLATVAALIGGGGFGVFVFQGLGQNATDLVLLGALPTVALAFASATVLDAAIDFATITRKGDAP